MKKALSLMLALVLAFGVLVSVPIVELPLSISANAASVEGLVFALNSDGASYSVIDCNEYAEGEMVIPSEHNGLPVTRIGNTAFYNCVELETITVPETVVFIGNSAFSGCTKLKYAYLPDDITSIGKWAFYNCNSLISVSIPKGLKSIPYWCFANCKSLEYVAFKGEVKNVDRSAFKSCNKLKEVELPDTITSIGENAFDCAGVNQIKIPESMTTVDCSVFVNCYDLKQVWFPGKVKSVNSDAFGGCENIKEVFYEDTSANWDNITFGSNNEYLTNAKIHYDVPSESIETHYAGVVAVEPDCINEGQMQYSCPCGHSYTEVIPALGHSFTTEWTVETQSTCTVEGLKYHYCTRCGEKSDITTIPVDSDAHSYGDYIIDAQPTCTVDGAKHKECEYCGTKSEAEVIFATGHSYGTWIVTEATCTADGSKHKECVNCGAKAEEEVISATGHTSSDWIVDSSTKRHKECVVCGEVLETAITKTVEALNAPRLKAISNAIGAVKLSWGAVEDAEGYIVYRKVKGGKWETLGKIDGTSYADKTAKSGTTYYYTVKAYYQNIKSSYKGTLSIKYLDAPKLASVATDSKGIKFTWGKVKGAGGYYVYRKVEGGSWVRLASTKGTSYVDKKAPSGVTYYYTAKAYNGKVKSAHYDGVGIVSLATPKIISISNTENGVKFTWGKVKGADGYVVYRKVRGGKWENLGKLSGNSYTDKNAKSGTTYYYTVRAYKGNVKSGYYENYSIKYLATPKLNSISSTTNSIKLEWSKVTGAEKYRVYRKTENGKWQNIATVKTTSYTDKTAKNGVKYIYTVRAESKKTLSYFDTEGIAGKLETVAQTQKPAQSNKPGNQNNKPDNQSNKPNNQNNKPGNHTNKPNNSGIHNQGKPNKH